MRAPPSAAGAALLTGTLAYAVTSLFWGANVPLTAILFRYFDPFFLAPLRVLIATAVLAAIGAAAYGLRALAVPVGAGRLAAMSGAMAGFFVLYNVGLSLTNTITAAAIMAGAPVYAAITMRLVSGSRLERGFGIAITLTVAGAALAVWSRADAGGGSFRLQGGEPLIVLSLVCWTVYSIMAQRWFAPGTPQLLRTWIATGATALWLAAAWALLWAAGAAGSVRSAPDAEAWLYLGLTAGFATALGGALWNIGVARVGLAAGTIWQNTVPVFAVLVSMLFGFVPTGGQVLGAALVIAGVMSMQWHRLRAAR